MQSPENEYWVNKEESISVYRNKAAQAQDKKGGPGEGEKGGG